MIRLNVFFLIEKSENREPLIKAATELVELSLHDNGCVAYDVYSSLTADDVLMICETWRTKADLEAHMQSEHFKRLVPEMQKLATMTLEEFNF